MTDASDIINKQERLNKAGKHNQELSKEHLSALGKFYDNLALYSAGAISLSVTFMGYIISSKPEVLNESIFGFGIINFLYISWFAFVVSFIASLLVKKYSAYHLSAFGFSNYTKHYKEFCEVKVQYLKSNPQDLIFQDGDLDENLNVQKSNLNKISKAHNHNVGKEKKYLKTTKVLKLLSEFGVFLGIILLVTFSVFITRLLIK